MQDIHGFIGVNTTDKLKRPRCYPCYAIANFSTLYAVETHFIAITFLKNDWCIYFDPLNFSFIPYKVELYLHHIEVVFRLNCSIQNPLSDCCGLFCLMPTMFHVNIIPMYLGVKSFQESPQTNDDKCIGMVRDIFMSYYLEH